MAREKKDGTKVTYIIENALLRELEDYCEKTGLTKTKVIEFALREYLKEKGGNKNDGH